MNAHDLTGCAPIPLAHYLKALGVLRLVAEQADGKARARWDGERFILLTSFTEEELVSFFAERYSPTPVFSPWNRGSGFFTKNDKVLSGVENSRALRFADLREGLVAARQSAQGYLEADAADQLKEAKGDLLLATRCHWRGRLREWLDAAVVVGADGRLRYPALLGTGGNDGRFDFTYNYLQRLGELFNFSDDDGKPRRGTVEAIRAALFATPARVVKAGRPIGQFLPGVAGGANNSNGPEAQSGINPADFVLLLEGAILFTAQITRRLGTSTGSMAAAPFVFEGRNAGHASAAEGEKNTRGEQWMPLWSQPVGLRELKLLLREGRAQVGATVARDGLDFACAVARLGTARGVAAFQRYGYAERNGLSNLAVPLGRFFVPSAANPRVALLDEVDPWRQRVGRRAGDEHAPGSLRRVNRELNESIFAVTRAPDHPARWQALLLTMAGVEAALMTSSAAQTGPIPRLGPEWIAAADDGSPEFRLAVACGLQAESFASNGRAVDPVRHHWLPLDVHGRLALSGTALQARLIDDPRVVMTGRSGLEDAVALVERRILEARQHGGMPFPLTAAPGTGAGAADLAAALACTVDFDRVMRLARAFAAVDPIAWRNGHPAISRAGSGAMPDEAWMAIRLAHTAGTLRASLAIPTDPCIVRRLSSGDAPGAVVVALRRLGAAGLHAAFRCATATPAQARRWAAALAFPISQRTADRFADCLAPAIEKGE